jgi:hypothetical protein
VLLGRPGREEAVVRNAPLRNRNVFEKKGNLVTLEGVLGKETGPKDFTIVTMKSTRASRSSSDRWQV